MTISTMNMRLTDALPGTIAQSPLKQTYTIGVLPGEGIGPEIIDASLRLLKIIEENTTHRFDLRYGGAIGLPAIQESGCALTPEVIAFCTDIFANHGAILCGPGGGRFVYELRREFDLYCKLIPIKPWHALRNATLLKASVTTNTDMVIVRENVGGIYQGSAVQNEQSINHTFSYSEQQVKRLLQVAVKLASQRKQRLCVVTKPYGLAAISALWHDCAQTLAREHNVTLSHLEVDNAAYQLIANPEQFDVIAAPNLFGDILGDIAALLLGSRGLSYSANYGPFGQAVYQTGHGAAYDLTGKNSANPLGQMTSLAMMLHESFGLTTEAEALHAAIEDSLSQGFRTADLLRYSTAALSTDRFTDKLIDNFRKRLSPQPSSRKTPQTRPALLLIDVQQDFLNRLEATEQQRLVVELQQLLLFCRQHHIPIVHIFTKINPDGSNRMPHWVEQNTWACIEGTAGASAPEILLPQGTEACFYKSFFNAFNRHDDSLEHYLHSQRVNTVLLSGLYVHGCIRESAISAYERGYGVWIAAEAVSSNEPWHAVVSRTWMQQRCMHFLTLDTIKERLQLTPSNTHLLHNKNNTDITKAADAAAAYFTTWQHISMDVRRHYLRQWYEILSKRAATLVQLLVDEIHKPLADANEEMHRALAHLEYICNAALPMQETISEHAEVRYCPRGCYAIITPWNNPIAIPVSKIAAALLYGNTVLWKPAVESDCISQALMDSLTDTEIPLDCVHRLPGDQFTAEQIIINSQVTAVSVTGSLQTGHNVAGLCSAHNKTLQAELGGNNACIIMDNVDLKPIIKSLALSAFSFAGQRCTAIRRFIVLRGIVGTFIDLMVQTTQTLRIGSPHDPNTEIGPMINIARRERLQQHLSEAIAAGAIVCCGGKIPSTFPQEAFFEPTLLTNVLPHAPIVQTETFGPLAIIQIADTLEQAVQLANSVAQGLLTCVITHDPQVKNYCKQHLETGILRFTPGPVEILPSCPFGGWKASQIGLPEHGRWDRDFYTRTQVIYDH